MFKMLRKYVANELTKERHASVISLLSFDGSSLGDFFVNQNSVHLSFLCHLQRRRNNRKRHRNLLAVPGVCIDQ